MSRSPLSVLLALTVTSKLAQLTQHHLLTRPSPLSLCTEFTQYQILKPYQVDYNTAAICSPQVSYNICNSTTKNQNSMCQISMVNHIDDFCLWAPPSPNSTIGDTEQEEVAWCTKPGHGTFLIPNGALQVHIQVAGFIDQTQVNMNAQDYGGELDPRAESTFIRRGNPLGGLMYSNVFPSNGGNNNSPTSKLSTGQTQTSPLTARISTSYNMPNNAQSGTFEVCDSDLTTPAGLYVTDGVTVTYSQPNSGVVNPPYTAVIPASSNCVTYASAALHTGLATVTPTSVAASASGATGTAKASSTGAATAT
ncbi:hypothetical protein BDR05DRAFT_1016532 [Suillus weaverae]|nr:hypothetical protein BDR05DRAFT_1016532 [Suillus weaverae]